MDCKLWFIAVYNFIADQVYRVNRIYNNLKYEGITNGRVLLCAPKEGANYFSVTGIRFALDFCAYDYGLGVNAIRVLVLRAIFTFFVFEIYLINYLNFLILTWCGG